jgi:TPR repeat protein
MACKKWNRLNAEARAGDAEAQWQLGSWLEDGIADIRGAILARPDARRAVMWYRKSAIGGNSVGQVHLGVCLCVGRGVRRNNTEALLWFKRAYSQNDLCAAGNIASTYRDLGNNRRAIFWYQRAVALGDGDALVEVGCAYYKGIGVKRDPKHAVLCFRQAIKSKMITQAGRENAMFHLGFAFHEGRGVKKSDARAIRWFSKANQDGDHAEATQLIQTIRNEARLTT